MKKIKLFEEFNSPEVIQESFYRLPSDVIGNDLYMVSKNLMNFYDSAKAGNDVDPGVLDSIIKKLNEIKKSVKKFNKAEEVAGTVYEGEVNIFDEIGPELEALRSKISGLMKKSTDDKWTSALGKALSAVSTLDRNLSQADSKLGVVLTESEINEGGVKRFEMDYKDMENSIKRGIGWIDPEYVVDTWENSSDSIDFELVASEIYNRLIKAGLLWTSEDGETKDKQVKSLKELGIKESVEINEAFEVKVSLKHAKDAIALFNDMFIKYGKRPSTDVFSFKEKDAAVDFVQMLIKNLQIPMGEITTDDVIIKNLK
mgnify:CR=1 FL=1|jgi:hypothetical protein